MDNEHFLQLSRDIWPMGTPTAGNGTPQLVDYALGGLDLAATELERRANKAHKQSKVLLDIALHPERYDFTD